MEQSPRTKRLSSKQKDTWLKMRTKIKTIQNINFQRHLMYFSSIVCNEKHQIRGIFNTFIENRKL